MSTSRPTIAEVKATALGLMSDGGPDAITLRAIARLLVWAETFRVWPLANSEGFRLIYSDPVRD